MVLDRAEVDQLVRLHRHHDGIFDWHLTVKRGYDSLVSAGRVAAHIVGNPMSLSDRQPRVVLSVALVAHGIEELELCDCLV